MRAGYGKRIRKAVDEIGKRSKATYKCPSCSRSAVKREANGLWHCRKCDVKFASGAFGFKK